MAKNPEKLEKLLGKISHNHWTNDSVLMPAEGLSDNDAVALAEALKNFRSIINLRLENNRIGDRGAKALAAAQASNPNIQEIVLARNPIGDNGVMALVENLQPNSPIIGLDVSGCNASADCYDSAAHHILHVQPKNLLFVKLNGQEEREDISTLLSDSNQVEEWRDAILEQEDPVDIANICLLYDRYPAMEGITSASQQDEVRQFLENLPSLDRHETIGAKQLLQKFKGGITPLDNPETWENLPELREKLDKPMTKEFLLTTNNKDGDPVICNAIRAGCTAEVLDMLMAQGERLEPEDMPPLVEAFYDASIHESRTLFTEEHFKGQPRQKLKQTMDAIQVEAQDIPNYHALRAQLSKQERLKPRSV